jgi:hypothetical protein
MIFESLDIDIYYGIAGLHQNYVKTLKFRNLLGAGRKPES